MSTVARLACRAQVGLSAPPVQVQVQVEVTLASGLPVFHIVGLPATVVKESRERVRAALLSSGFEYPAGRIIVNLAPAEVPKEGGRFELPMALGILVASGQIKPVRGIVLAAARARREGHELIVPRTNLEEALIVAAGHVRAACLTQPGSDPYE